MSGRGSKIDRVQANSLTVAAKIAQHFSIINVNILSKFYNFFTTFWSPGYVISVAVLFA